MKKWLGFTALLAAGILVGIIANRNRSSLINAQFIRNHWHFRKALADKNKIVQSKNVMIVLSLGQSNAADYGSGIYHCKNEVYNYYKGDLYKAVEPLLGAEGDGSSVWTRIADKLIDSGLYKKVIIIPCAVGSTSVENWSDGECSRMLAKTLDYLAKDHIQPTHIFWEQGETDNVKQTSKTLYKLRLKKIISSIRQKGFRADFYCAITSYVPYNNPATLGISKTITDAQHETVKEINHVKEGPNTDSLNLAYYRQSDMHFTEMGLDKLADSWVKKIKANY